MAGLVGNPRQHALPSTLQEYDFVSANNGGSGGCVALVQRLMLRRPSAVRRDGLLEPIFTASTHVCHVRQSRSVVFPLTTAFVPRPSGERGML